MSSETPSSAPRPLRLEDLVTFCHELAALVRAQVPLSAGLTGGAFQSSQRLQEVAWRLAEHESGGRSLDEALRAEASTWPPVIRAVLEAGLLSGRLPDALDGMAKTAEMQISVRRRLGSALIYPAVLLITAAGLLSIFSAKLLWGVRSVYESGPIPPPGWIVRLSEVFQQAPLWGMLSPIIILAFVAGWILRSRSLSAGGVAASMPLAWLPGLSGMRRNLRLGTAADLLSLLTAHGVPLPRAFRLAGEATGSGSLNASCRIAAERLEQGQPLATALRAGTAIPRPFADLLISADRQGGLPAACRELASIHYRRADYTAEWFKVVAPIFTTVFLCGGIVMLYTASVFGPVVQMLHDVARETAM